MKRKRNIEYMNCSTYRLQLTEEQEKAFNKVFFEANRFSNEVVTFFNGLIEEYSKTDEQFAKALYYVKNQTKIEGNSTTKKDRTEELNKSYDIISQVAKEQNFFSSTNLSVLKSQLSDYYKIWLPDEVRSSLIDNKIKAYSVMFFKRVGKSVSYKPLKDLLGISCPAEYTINKNGERVPSKHIPTMRIRYDENDRPYLYFWDCRHKAMENAIKNYDENIGSFVTKMCNHKFTKYYFHIDRKNPIQNQIYTDRDKLGQLKISRIYKNGKWRYMLQVNFETLSPVVRKLNKAKAPHKVAIKFQTETTASVRDDGMQGIIELSPSTPRIFRQIQDIDIYMDNSRRIHNPKLYNKNGTIKYSKAQMKELGLRWKFTETYIEKRKLHSELYRKNTDARKRNSDIVAKSLVELGTEFVLYKHYFKSWGMKRCRMSKKSKQRCEDSGRNRDYTRQIHDRCPRCCLCKDKISSNTIKICC